MLLTVILWGASSEARVLANPTTPARAMLERTRLSTGCLTEYEVRLITLPQRRGIMWGMTSLVMNTVLSRFRSRASCQEESGKLRRFPAGGPPELFTRTSIWPKRLSVSSTSFVCDSRSDTSRVKARISTPVSSSIWRLVSSSASCPRAQIVTRAPSLANPRAIARPRPLLEAKTIATRPFSPRSMAFFSKTVSLQKDLL